MISFKGVDPSVPLEDRELYFQSLRNSEKRPEVILSTCDRIEIYSGEGLPDESTFRHLLRVVAGLESPMVGENQILGQVKAAYSQACLAFKLSPGLHKMFQTALRVGKRVRTETKINQGAIGHAQTVVNILKAQNLNIKNLKIVVVGVNNLNKGILKFFLELGNQTFFLGNRNLVKAQDLCKELGGGAAIPLDYLADHLKLADIVISATSAPHQIIQSHHLPDLGGPRWFFDLAVPRDIAPEIGLRPGVKLYNVTDLEKEAAKTLTLRRGEITAAEAIIQEETNHFFQKERMLH